MTAAARSGSAMRAVFGIALALFAMELLANAWMVDDAYITLRTVDNWVNGYGLRWNVAERVQAYTHPLWMLLLAAFYAITHETFFTVIAVSFAISLAAVLVAVYSAARNASWKAALLLLAFLACKAVMDFASSGLENPLSYLLAALLMLALPRALESPHPRDRALPVLLAALAFLTRPDSVLLYLPAMALVSRSGRWNGAWLRALALALSPAIAWTIFSLVYYGFPFPNTAYAKSFVSGIPLDWRIERGLEYVGNSIAWDWPSYAMLVAACAMALRRKSPTSIALLAGVLLYLAGIVVNFASATHMSGRLLSLPLFVAIATFVASLESRRMGALAAGALAAFIAWSPVSAPKFATRFYHPYAVEQSYIDTKWFVLNEGAALLDWRPGVAMPDHGWYHIGERMRADPQRVFVGGVAGAAIGYAGFAAGPGKFIIDTMGLSDPLLARLPVARPPARNAWKSGHFLRTVPAGYLESVERGENLVVDPKLHAFYDQLRLVTRGPLLDRHRLAAVWRLNSGGIISDSGGEP